MSRNIILADNAEARLNLLPLTFTRPIARLLTGLFTIEERWQRYLPGDYSYLTADYLSEVFPFRASGDDNLIIDSRVIADRQLSEAVSALQMGEGLMAGDVLVARRGAVDGEAATLREYDGQVTVINRPFDVFLTNGAALESDFAEVTRGRASQPEPQSCMVIGDVSRLFIEEGATVSGAVINVETGPVYIGRGATVMEGACMRGPIAILDHSTVNMGAKIYGATTIGPHSKVGGELNNVVILGYSNKAHDGFLGNAVIGEWCNLGAGCTASNLKNDYTEIKLWNYASRRFQRSGLQFCGLIMGDHSKGGINTMFNTATVLGVGVNVHGTGFPRNFVPSFSDGSAAGFSEQSLQKFLDVATRVMARRDRTLGDAEVRMYEALYSLTETYR